MAYTIANIAGAVSQADADNRSERLADLQLRAGEQNLSQGSRVADLQYEGAQMDVQTKKRAEAMQQIKSSGKLAEQVIASGGKNFADFQSTLQQLGVPPDKIPKQYDQAEMQNLVDKSKAFLTQQEKMLGLPSSVQETEIFRGKPKDWQDTHLNLKRSQQMLNLGGQQVVLDPRGGVRESYPVTPKPDQMPGFRASVAGAEEQAKTNVKVGAEQDKKIRGANSVISNLNEAEKLLSNASGGYAQTALSAGKKAFNVSDNATQANQQLKLVSGWLVSNVPRMEGPQSNFDVENYRTMAADVGNITIPIGDRLAALKQLRSLQEKYAALNGAPKSDNGPIQVDW